MRREVSGWFLPSLGFITNKKVFLVVLDGSTILLDGRVRPHAQSVPLLEVQPAIDSESYILDDGFWKGTGGRRDVSDKPLDEPLADLPARLRVGVSPQVSTSPKTDQARPPGSETRGGRVSATVGPCGSDEMKSNLTPSRPSVCGSEWTFYADARGRGWRGVKPETRSKVVPGRRREVFSVGTKWDLSAVSCWGVQRSRDPRRRFGGEVWLRWASFGYRHCVRSFGT